MTWRAAALVGLAALLRAPGLFTDFWLDEVWALSNLAAISSPIQVFTGIHHDSNHWLVSLWMYAVGPNAAFWTYRLPSILAGVALVLAAGALAGLEGSSRRLAMLFTGTSFPLVFYASEARGYSLAALAAVLSILFLVRFLEDGKNRWLLGCSFIAAFGILSHLSFLIVLAGSFFFALVMAGRGRISLARTALVPAIPAVVIALLFLVDLRHLTLGGGPRLAPVAILAQTTSLAVGGPVDGPATWVVASFGALVLALEIGRRVRRFWPLRRRSEPREHLWMFYAAVLLLPPWLALVLDPPFLFPRYFLVVIVFVPVLAASLASSMPRLGGYALLGLWLGVNGLSWMRFTEEGRGGYREALRAVLDESEREPALVGSDHDFRNGMLVEFYRSRVPGGERLKYVSRGDEAASYWIASLDGSPCTGCRLLGSYPSSTLSGARWRLYERSQKSQK